MPLGMITLWYKSTRRHYPMFYENQRDRIEFKESGDWVYHLRNVEKNSKKVETRVADFNLLTVYSFA